MSLSKVLLGFVAGAAAGVLAGILLAPDKGSETRKKITRKTSEASDAVKNSFSEFIDDVKGTFSSVASEAGDLEDQGKRKLNEMKQQAKNAMS